MDFFSNVKTYILFLAGIFPEDCPDEEDMLREMSTTVTYDEAESSSVESSADEVSLPDEDLQITASGGNAFPDLFSNVPSGMPIEYEELPVYFTGLDSWPKSTNRLCWNCHNSFSGIPWFIAIQLLKRPLPVPSYSDISSLIPTVDDNFESIETPTRTKDVPALRTHGCFCSPYCAKRYILYVKDAKVANIWEAVNLLNLEYFYFIGKEIQDIPEADDPMIQIQYKGPSGLTSQKYRERNENRRVN